MGNATEGNTKQKIKFAMSIIKNSFFIGHLFLFVY